jgi:transketolase
MIIAKTYKGKGVSFLEDKEGRHAKALGKEELEKALLELGDVDTSFMIPIRKPDPVTDIPPRALRAHIQTVPYTRDDLIATREAYGYAIGELAQQHKDIIVLDADMSNSTFAEVVKHHTSNQFFEMFIAEQNMVGVGVGLSTRKKIPFISTYAAFLTRAFDQMRMAGYAKANLKIIGSHGGISIGPDGMSQMGLEDIAMMRSVFGSVVLYPSDGVSTIRLVEAMAKYQGLAYLRTTRGKTPVIYDADEQFPIGGSKVHTISDEPHSHVIVGAGITLHEALKAQKQLAEKSVNTVVVDLYSIKPIDTQTLLSLTKDKQPVVVVEDHYPEGGIGEAVRSAIGNTGVQITSLAIRKMPMSGKPEELLRYEQIDAAAIRESISA